MTCYLGIDYGTKRIGLAISGAEATIASPLVTVAVRGGLGDHVRAVLARTEEYDVDEFVVGLPLNMDDSEGPQAKASRRFGEELARVTDKPVHFFDERLSSVEAKETLLSAGLTRKQRKARVDPLAAQNMLQGFLDAIARQ